MGMDYSNGRPGPHYTTISGVRVLVGIKPAIHHGNQNVDAVVDHEAVGTGLAAILAAAQVSTLAFGQACAAEWPNSWDPFVPYVEDVRQDVLRL